MNICPFCHTGRLQRQTIAYVQWYGEALLVVDRMPAIVCDLCGERTYDEQAVERLQHLLLTGVPGQPSMSSSRLA